MVPTPAQFLNSPDASQHVSWKTMYNSLNLGLSSRNQMVRAMSLKGLGSTLMHPKKVRGRNLRDIPSAIPEGSQGGHKRSGWKGIFSQGWWRDHQAWLALLNCFV